MEILCQQSGDGIWTVLHLCVQRAMWVSYLKECLPEKSEKIHTCHMTILKVNRGPTKSHNTFLFFTTTMKAINPTTKATVIHMLQSGFSIRQIASQLSLSHGTVGNIHSKHCPGLANPSGGHPLEPSASDIKHALYLFSSKKAENAVQVTQTLRDVGGTFLSASIIRRHLKALF